METVCSWLFFVVQNHGIVNGNFPDVQHVETELGGRHFCEKSHKIGKGLIGKLKN